jgi:hypothetical protein
MQTTSRPPADGVLAKGSLRCLSGEDGILARRRWMSFLTWAFILGEMAGRDGLLPTAAHAAADDLGRASHAGSETASIANNLPNISVSTATEGPEPITYQHAPTIPAYAPTALSSELGEAKIAPAVDVLAAHGQGAAGGGGHGFADDGMHAGEATFAAGALAEGPFAAFDLAGQPLDLGLHIDLSDTTYGLLGGIADGLGKVPLVGGLLAGDTLASTTSDLLATAEPVVSLFGFHGGNVGTSSSIGSPGQLSFADGTAPAASHELAAPGGGYTNYGIALNLGDSDVAHGSAEGAVHADALGTSMLDSSPMDHLPVSEADALHLDQSALRTASDILA